MERRGSYGGGYRDEVARQEQPGKAPEKRQDTPRNQIAEASFEQFSDQDWEQVEQLHETRGNVMGTLENGIQSEEINIDGAESDPKYWKIMGESLQTLGLPRNYIDQYLGKMESIMTRAKQEGPQALTEHQGYIDTALEALKQCMVAVRTHDRQLKASGSQFTTPWEGMQLRWKVENDKMAQEKARRDGGREQVEESDNVEDLQAFREEKSAKEQKGFVFPEVSVNKRNPKYWESMAGTLAEDPRLRGVARSINSLIRRVERNDEDSILDAEIEKIVDDINRKTAA